MGELLLAGISLKSSHKADYSQESMEKNKRKFSNENKFFTLNSYHSYAFIGGIMQNSISQCRSNRARQGPCG
jgi:hypothetical protein